MNSAQADSMDERQLVSMPDRFLICEVPTLLESKLHVKAELSPPPACTRPNFVISKLFILDLDIPASMKSF